MFLNQRGEERKRLVVFINVLINFKFVRSNLYTILGVFFVLLQNDADQETEKDDAPASPVSPSGRLCFL